MQTVPLNRILMWLLILTTGKNVKRRATSPRVRGTPAWQWVPSAREAVTTLPMQECGVGGRGSSVQSLEELVFFLWLVSVPDVLARGVSASL